MPKWSTVCMRPALCDWEERSPPSSRSWCRTRRAIRGNRAATPGGSSSGSAAAVASASRRPPSARRPTVRSSGRRRSAAWWATSPARACCRPTACCRSAPRLDQPGVFARSVEDAALLVANLAHSRWTISTQITALKHAPRLVAARTPVWNLAEPDQRSRFTADIAMLREAAAIVDEVELPSSFNDAHACIESSCCTKLHRHRARCASITRNKFSEILHARWRKATASRRPNTNARCVSARRCSATSRASSTTTTRWSRRRRPAKRPLAAKYRRPELLHDLDLARRARHLHPHRPRVAGLAARAAIIGNQGESNHLLATAMWCERQIPFRGLLAREKAGS